jgi:predicted ATP-grasp superfamily ATP-dependent carboligase
VSSRSGLTPVLLLGGQENALSIARSLGARGVPVSVSAPRTCWALRSRYCARQYVVPPRESSADYWENLLLGGDASLDGSVLFACSDEASEFMSARRDRLASRYLLDDHLASQQIAMLDKRETTRLAAQVGIPTPKQWPVHGVADLEAIEPSLDFPVLLRPIHSHKFQRVFHKKLFIVRDASELRAKVAEAVAHRVEVIVCELIPGPDDLLSSYYTYIAPDGQHLFHFTKRIIRRSPLNFGLASYHATEWLPDTAEMGKRFFRGINFRGLGNVEFKRDPRDGQLKLIEVNARFTAPQELLVQAEMDIGWIIYLHVTGGVVPPANGFKEHLRLWHFLDDFDAYRDLRALGQLSFASWVRSVARPQVLPYFSLRDPKPAVAKGWNTFRTRVLKRRRAQSV